MDLPDKVNAIERLARLHAEGTLSDVEFSQAKETLLGDSGGAVAADHASDAAFMRTQNEDRSGFDISRRTKLVAAGMVTVLVLGVGYLSLSPSATVPKAAETQKEISSPAQASPTELPVVDATEAKANTEAEPTDTGDAGYDTNELVASIRASPEGWQTSEVQLIAEWEVLNESCRGSEFDGPICQLRDSLSERLNAANICYTKKTDEGMPDAKMHRCGPDSERFGGTE